LEALARRYEHPRYEVAVFGRVSSGKSSLLNHLCGADVLPVGVTPITAVPTRVERGDVAECIVTIAESGPRRVDVAQLREFASEERNPGNHRHVTDLLVRLPSQRLRDGVVLVDTPGVGSLARSGAAETWAYLPRCDLGIVLIDAHSAPSHDDVDLIHRLVDAGIPVQVLVSKSDLVGPQERAKLIEYIQAQLRGELGMVLPVHAVSVLGDDATLLDDWFDRELTPLLDRSRELAARSLRLKIADLRDAVIAVLEALRGRRHGPADEQNLAEIGEQLESADAAIRAARSSAWRWTDRDGVLVDAAIDEAARTMVHGAPVAKPVSDALQSVLAERSQSALRSVQSLQRKLGSTIERLRATPLGTGLDPSAVTGLVISGLPDVDLSQFNSNGEAPRSWWSGLAPNLAERTVNRSIRKRFGPSISHHVMQYDRQLRLWLGQAIEQLVDAYEAQAGVVREQLRRARVGDSASSPGNGKSRIDSAIRELRSASEQAPESAEQESTALSAAPRG
jgi:GTP-binding protein EngB required for normal cell division